MAIDQWFAQHFQFRDVIKTFLDDVFLKLFKIFNVFVVSQFVHVDPVRFMAPESDNVQRGGGAVIGGEQQALEDIGQVPKVEDVVELDRCWHENLKVNKG